MIKHINHQNVTTTPFVAAKARVLSNIQNDDTVILEPNAYANGTNVSLDYVDYNGGNPIINRECDIALEQQGLDSLGYEEGITGSATFDSASDAQNTDGTYQTLVHRQTKNAFYNSYHNPTEIFGVEHIDFPLSKTLRNLADHFRMFSIPPEVFGDKIQPKSLHFYDTLLDDNVEIFDDGYQNLVAGYNLFSKVQEVRTWPSMSQWIITGSVTASCNCPQYDELFITDPMDVYAEYGSNAVFFTSGSGNPRPLSYHWYSGSVLLGDGGQISGSHSTHLYINNVTFANTGSYRVMANNAYPGTRGATSSFANLHILTHPPIIGNPSDDYEEIGSNFNFCAPLLSGSSPLYWQWYSGSTLLVDNGHYSGSNTSCLRINNIQIADTGSYRVMVGNFFGNTTSSWANGHVNLYAPLIVSNPQPQTVYWGFSASFHVTASGTLPLMYHWYSGSFPVTDNTRITGSILTGSTTSSLFINDVNWPDSGSYHVVVTNFIGSATSNGALLTILDNSVPVSATDTSSMDVSLRFGSTNTAPPVTEPSMPSFAFTVVSGSIVDVVLTASVSGDSQSIFMGFENGYIFDVVLPQPPIGFDSQSIFVGFDGGYIFDVLLPQPPMGFDSQSIGMEFSGGYIQTIVTPTSAIEAPFAFGFTMVSGSVF